MLIKVGVVSELRHTTYPRPELALGQLTDEEIFHSVLVVLIRRHVQTNAGFIHVSKHIKVDRFTIVYCILLWFTVVYCGLL